MAYLKILLKHLRVETAVSACSRCPAMIRAGYIPVATGNSARLPLTAIMLQLMRQQHWPCRTHEAEWLEYEMYKLPFCMPAQSLLTFVLIT
jgi:hypothetical protein